MKKNPFRQLYRVVKTWRKLRSIPGLFDWRDACMQVNRVILPARFHYRAGGQRLARHTVSTARPGVGYEVLIKAEGLRFFWPEPPDNNLWFLIEQEIHPGNPHHYLTPPVALEPASLILDVGACEGLFALRALKRGLASHVICFEPSARMADLIRRGGEANEVGGRLTVETLAVDRSSGWVHLQEGVGAEANYIQAGATGGTRIQAVALDDYCGQHGHQLSARDLIKIDAEGMDFEVLRGAEKSIRGGSPQIAVTTYHRDEHCVEIAQWLRQLEPRYRLRLKGFSFWTERPRPVLLQAAR